jgi:hypothetical protein
MSPWRTSGNEIYYNDGNVSIGTTNPDARVHSQSTGGVPSFLAGGSSADFAVPSNNQAMQFGSWDGSSVFTEWMRIGPAGNVGIGTPSPNHPLHMASGAHVTAGGVWTDASSRAYKENIHALSTEAALSALEALTPVEFTYKVDKDEACLGFIAEDVPALVATKDRKGLSAMDIVAMLTKVVQHQQQQIAELQTRLKTMEK